MPCGAELRRRTRSVQADGLPEAVHHLLGLEVAYETFREGRELHERGVFKLDGDVVSDDFDVLFRVQELYLLLRVR